MQTGSIDVNGGAMPTLRTAQVFCSGGGTEGAEHTYNLLKGRKKYPD